MSTTDIQAGKTYHINHSRKGKFTGTVTKFDDTWADVLIVMGRAKAMLAYNEANEGETVTVRRSFCTFTEVDAITAHYVDRNNSGQAALAK